MYKFTILLIIVIIILIVTSITRRELKKNRKKIKIQRNLEYTVNNRSYKIPDLPVIGNAYIMNDDFFDKMYKLYRNVKKALDESGIEFWISGGTLLGFERHNTFLPWDDDIDIHINFKEKKNVFSDQFKNTLNRFGIDPLFMVGTDEDFTFYKGGLRLKLLEHLNPVMDIFFVTENVKGTITKIETWSNNMVVYNNKEIWDKSDIYPINKTRIDTLEINKPNNPHNVLTKQYTESYKDEIHCGHPPHTIAYDLLSVMWKNSPKSLFE